MPAQPRAGFGPDMTLEKNGNAEIVDKGGAEAKGEEAAAQSPRKRPRTELHADVQALVSRVCDAEMMRRHAASCGFDEPGLQQLSRLSIKEGLTWLRAIEQELLRTNPSPEALGSLSRSFSKALGGGAQHQVPGTIDSLEQVKAKALELEGLSDVESAYCRLLKIAAGRACLRKEVDNEEADAEEDGATADTAPSPSKRLMTPFFLFLADRRDAIKAELAATGDTGFGSVSKRAAEVWKALPEAEQEPYLAAYRKAKEAREQEFAEIRAREEAAAWEADPLANRFYRMLGCHLAPISRGSPVWGMLAECALGTQPETVAAGSHFVCLERAFSVTRPSEEKSFAKTAQNRRLLWYGCPLGTWASTLCNGVRLPQQETPYTGYNFGKGIYFSDMVSVAAASACPGARDGDRAMVLLAEVALGASVERQQADSRGATKIPPGHQSTLGRGLLAPSASRALPDGALLPLGPVQEQAAAAPLPPDAERLPHNEYVVYNPAHVRMRYLLEVRFLSGTSPETVLQARSETKAEAAASPLSAKRLRKKTHADETLLLS